MPELRPSPNILDLMYAEERRNNITTEQSQRPDIELMNYSNRIDCDNFINFTIGGTYELYFTPGAVYKIEDLKPVKRKKFHR